LKKGFEKPGILVIPNIFGVSELDKRPVLQSLLKICCLREIIYSQNLDIDECAAKFAGVPNAFGIAHQQISW